MKNIPRSKVLDGILVAAACALLIFSYRPLLGSLGSSLLKPEITAHSFGSNDFIEYWSAYRISSRGENPYSPEAMLAEQRLVDPTRETPLMMWNPPWLLVLMSPVLRFDFTPAVRLWLLAGVAAVLLSLLLCRLLTDLRGRALCGIALVLITLPPFWQSLSLGQSSILLLPAALAFCLLMKRERFFTAGLALSICTIKPHLFYLVWFYLLWWTVRTKRLSLFLGFISAFLLLGVSACLRYPEAFASWLQLLRSPSIQEQVMPSRWKTATLASALAAITPESIQASAQTLLATMVPCLTLLAVIFCLMKAPASASVKFIPGLLCLSLLTAPYGWFFDQVALAASYLTVRGLRPLALALILSALVTYVATEVAVWHHQLFWYPLIPLAFFLAQSSRK